MTKRPRPIIPVESRCRVVLRQLGEIWPDAAIAENRPGRSPVTGERKSLGRLLDHSLSHLSDLLGCMQADLRLDHNPALILREFNNRTGKYKPDANDPEFLIYRTSHGHHIKTNVRGDGAHRSDTSERVHQRRLARNREKRRAGGKKGWNSPRKSRKMPSRPFPKGRKIRM